jgi:hypothetical protein
LHVGRLQFLGVFDLFDEIPVRVSHSQDVNARHLDLVGSLVRFIGIESLDRGILFLGWLGTVWFRVLEGSVERVPELALSLLEAWRAADGGSSIV